ncbi:MAG: ankyrin repeat domain-containing protein [Candidatus Babeliaceae bacterium]|jgi:ankyrin repeat protein
MLNLLLLLTASTIAQAGGQICTPKHIDKDCKLVQAAMKNNIHDATRLLNLGANPNIQDKNGLTPLHGAVYNNAIEFVKYLLSNGAFVNVQGSYFIQIHADKDFLDSTPLLISKESIITKLLLRAGAQVNAQDYMGNTPLIYAVQRMHIKQIQELINYEANLFIKNTWGNTAVHYAFELAQSSSDIAQLLLYYAWQKELLPIIGTTKNKSGVTPLDLIPYTDAKLRTLVKGCIAQKPYAIKEIITAGAKVEYKQFAKKTRQKNVLLALRTRELTGTFDEKRF